MLTALKQPGEPLSGEHLQLCVRKDRLANVDAFLSSRSCRDIMAFIDKVVGTPLTVSNAIFLNHKPEAAFACGERKSWECGLLCHCNLWRSNVWDISNAAHLKGMIS